MALGDRNNSAAQLGQTASEDEEITRETSFISIPVPVIGECCVFTRTSVWTHLLGCQVSFPGIEVSSWSRKTE